MGIVKLNPVPAMSSEPSPGCGDITCWAWLRRLEMGICRLIMAQVSERLVLERDGIFATTEGGKDILMLFGGRGRSCCSSLVEEPGAADVKAHILR